MAWPSAVFWTPRTSQSEFSTTERSRRPGRVPAPFVPPQPGPTFAGGVSASDDAPGRSG